ncbi:uncharacterized protein LOC118647377 [Monomorium pharaonis]|uniref:uncharacterized protein LOC118647377 n=1 Tax=Monomorium pharaonis TaxID=307658 RepID=UPI0017475ABB|nr:uncharacterized protein LOC118647377 [Monomorium pharaonis]
MQKKWWLCYATDFQSLMYPCFICCRIFGIFPYKFNASTFEISKSRHILSTVVICVCCVINLSFIYDIISKMYLGEVTILNFHFLTYHVIYNLIPLIMNILSVPQMHLLQTILEISSKVPQKSYQKLSRFIHVKDIFGIIFQFVHLYMNFSKLRKLPLNIFVIAVRTYFVLVVYQTNMLYINYVCILKACLKNNNDKLMHMQRLMLNDTKSYMPMFIYHVQRNQLLLMELKNLKKRHLMIGNAVQKLNIVFSLQLLATLVMTFINITFVLYFRVVHWQNGIFISLDRQFLDVLSAFIYNTVITMLLAWVCETGKDQAQKISTTIHDLFNSTNDEKIKYEVVKL